MALGDHPRRTPLYGALMIAAAMIVATLLWQSSLVDWLRTTLLILCLPLAITGWVMTFRDLSRPLPRDRRRRGRP